jgi:hypothetical protein
MFPIHTKALFLTPLHHLEVTDPLGRGEKLNDTLRLTNDIESVVRKIPLEAQPEIGRMELRSICNAPMVAYSEMPLELVDTTSLKKHLITQMFRVGAFLSMLWLVKDNSVSVENGFAIAGPFIEERYWGIITHPVDGPQSITRFTREELALARELYRSIHGDALTDLDSPEDAKGGEVVAPTSTPLTRALFFTNAGRTTWHASVRIASYCSALETLLIAGATSELTFRLCQRVAWLLGETAAERTEVFGQMRTIYDIRSKAVHGSTLSANKTNNDLPKAVKNADALLRAVFKKVLTTKLLADYACGANRDAEVFEEYLQGLCLGTHLSG